MDAVRVATYIFLDLETSGLPHEEHNRTKITEISLVAVKRSHLLHCTKGESPRIKNKLILCLNPGRMIAVESTKITGLSNDLLEEEPYFKDTFDTINSFISTLRPPVCLLAHNGYKFDFPIFKTALNNIGKSLQNDLLCADTLLTYHDIFKKMTPQKSSSNRIGLSDVHENVEIVSQVATPLIGMDDSIDSVTSQDVSKDEVDSSNTLIDIQRANETTPKRNKSPALPATPLKRKSNGDSSKAKRRLTWNECLGMTMFNIYQKLVKKELYKCHEAESDCMMNLECAVMVCEEFVHWVDVNHCLFNDIPPMTIGVRLD